MSNVHLAVFRSITDEMKWIATLS